MKAQVLPRNRQQDIVMQEVGNEILIFDLKTHKAFSLNETSALIWQACDGNNDIKQIVELVSQKLKMTASEDMIRFAINELAKENLLTDTNEISSKFDGISRRDVIRKIGMGTLVAFPVISSIVAPTSAMAASTVAQLGDACVSTCTPLGIEQNNCSTTAPVPLGCCGGICTDISFGDCGITC